ncbi:MAG: hypothetical protein FWE19_09630 [Oscillospiraceae bacterium]|nr:hypothetical protein [Oscillospiraceae bacterium]
MKTENAALTFFLGANTPSGFVSKFEQLANPEAGGRAYILKGGPGCGKSTIIGKVAAAFEGEPGLELIACASDLGSLDGVIVPSKKFCVVDGTSPHLLEPKYPGAVESVIELSACWDECALQSCREEIVSLGANIARCQEYSCRYLAAAAALLGDSYRLALGCLNTPKLTAYLGRLSAKELSRGSGRMGKEKSRFLSAVTNRGPMKFTQSIKQLAERVYLINDEHGALSRMMLHSLRARALEQGYDVIACYCPLGPFDKLEHLFVPELSLGFVTSNRFHNFEAELSPYRIINTQRFMEEGCLKQHKKRMTWSRKAGAQMISQAGGLIAEAATLQGELESYYTAATDFAKVDKLTDELLEKLSSL